MGKHCLLSPSSSHRWLECPPSARLEETLENNGSTAAQEGTAAHALCEHKLKRALKMRSKRPTSEFDSDEMEECSDDYVAFIMEQLEEVKNVCSDPVVVIEQPLDLTGYVPEGFGTADCIIVADSTLSIIDFKYGLGVLVKADHNPQMMLYALGALELFDGIYDIDKVAMTIFQPRKQNISTFEMEVTALKSWAKEVLIPKATLAFKGEGQFACGDWCGFCRAANRCRKRSEEKLALAKEEFKLPPLLSDVEIEEILPKLEDLTKWADNLKAYVADVAIRHGHHWNGYKIVASRTNRKYKDEKAVSEIAISNGYEDIYRKSLIPLTEMEKLMGKETFKKLLSDQIYKPEGKPILVPESDKRPAIETVNDEFKEINHE